MADATANLRHRRWPRSPPCDQVLTVNGLPCWASWQHTDAAGASERSERELN
jgi:hypothetical protein